MYTRERERERDMAMDRKMSSRWTDRQVVWWLYYKVRKAEQGACIYKSGAVAIDVVICVAKREEK
jgi:hypothetical protein